MDAGRRACLVAALAGGLLVLATGTVGAANIVGTAKNDTLRGTPRADKLYGKRGNDRLYGRGGADVLVGGPGNDLLVGGPGPDTISCGPGRDTVQADVRDKVARDCEVVRGLPAPAPPPPPAPAPPPAPPPPPAPRAQPGIYCGNTVQGPALCLTTNGDGSAVVEVRTSSLVDCTQPSPIRFEFSIGFGGGTLPLGPDLSFALEYSGPLDAGTSEITNMQTTYFIRGTFTTDGRATGQLAVSSLTFDLQGNRYVCGQNPVDWTVTRQG